MRGGDRVVGGEPIPDLEGGRESMAGCSSQGGAGAAGSAGSSLHLSTAGGNEWDRLLDFHGRWIVMVIDDFTAVSAMGGEGWGRTRGAACCGGTGSLGALISISPYSVSTTSSSSGLSRRREDERSIEKLGAIVVGRPRGARIERVL